MGIGLNSAREVASLLRRTVSAVIPLTLGLGLFATPALAQTASGNLTDLMNSGLYAFNGLEIAAAHENDAAYAALLPICATNPATGAPASAACSGNTLLLFDRLRELEDTANELLHRGEFTFSLRLGAQALGLALRWTAPEEYAAQGSLTSKFANSQLTTLSGRFASLRFATQVRLARGYDSDYGTDGPRLSYYSAGSMQGGAAGADPAAPSSLSNWGAFANGSYSAGTHSPTTFEDAFNYNDTDYSAGADYRLNGHTVVGFLADHTIKHVNFNSAESTVAGGIEGNGYGVIAYAQFEGDAAYVNVSLGFQHLSLDTRRSITYPSLNPAIPSVNEVSTSSTTASSWIGAAGSGYTFHWGGFQTEPYLNLQYVHTSINDFTEHDGDGFDIAVAGQSIPSLTSALGLKLQHVFLPNFGVIVPFVYGEYRHEFMQNSRTIDSQYADAGVGVGNDSGFNLPTDAATRNYYAAGAGLTVVLKHGFQAFAQYVKILSFANYTDYVASGGVRYEF